MRTKILTIILIFTMNEIVSAQSDSLLDLTRKISYYEDGAPKKTVTFLNDSCEYLDDYGIPIYTDYCRDGLYQEWFSNGQIKITGYYRYANLVDTIFSMSPVTLKMDTAIHAYMSSLKTGLWVSFDSVGNKTSTSRYVNGRLIANRYENNDTILKILNDSIRIKLNDYSTYSTFLINRSENNKILELHFPTFETHNYWKIYDYKKVDLLIDDFPTGHLFTWDKSLADLVADDSCGKHCKNYYDFADLPDGRYYIYYWSFQGVFHMIEIILNEI